MSPNQDVPPAASFREKVSALLREQVCSQSELASRMRCSPQFVSQLLRSAHRPSEETVQKVAEALGVSPETLDPGIARTSRRRFRSSALARMPGIEVAYLGAAMAALRHARNVLLELSPSAALTPAIGKRDTHNFDAVTENTIVDKLTDFNDRCAIFTEERRTFTDKSNAKNLAYFLDPFDRSRVFAKALERSHSGRIRDVIQDKSLAHMRGVDAPIGSVTCVRDSQVIFNVMVDYASGQVYVACSGMLKRGNIDHCQDPQTLADDGVDIDFEVGRQGQSCVCYVGSEQDPDKAKEYRDTFGKFFEISQLPSDPTRGAPGGPARILYLVDDEELSAPDRPAFIFSNGERICEWIGWLAYAQHSKHLAAFELFLDGHRATLRDQVLLAPPPSYSVFSNDQPNVDSDRSRTGPLPLRLNLDRLTVLQFPDTYRGAIAIVHRDSPQVAVLRAKKNCRELWPHQVFA